ncbi:hypothetical protein MKW98_029305 [Papaver atlanticum]|uniref:Large ribosomal subunit protein uL15/eL18 domain-containing protein n=1 Tax=Papaver atlanticum TaxID=357466 RepID=A0AAD4XF08_9MAGN|nr:hypothetical protein MKW98_029305 [Papaver atlanticum]
MSKMGIDLIAPGKSKKIKRTAPKSDVKLLCLLVPAKKVTALRFTDTARALTEKACGECTTWTEHDSFERTENSREAGTHLARALGVQHSHNKPYVCSKGRKFEKARGKRNSRGFRV